MIPMTTTDTPQAKKSVWPYFLGFILFLLILASYAGIFWLWKMQNTQLDDVSYTVKQSLKDFQSDSQQGLVVAKQADARSVELQAKTLLLEEKLTQVLEEEAQTKDLVAKLQTQAADTMVSEVEQLVKMADQQLKFAGNIKGAKMALQAADLPLAQTSNPAFIDIREALGNDLEALKTFPDVDMAALSGKLETILQFTENLPLLQDQDGMHDHVVEEVATETTESKILQENLWDRFKDFVMVEKLDAPAQPLVSVEQKFYLKENLKLRLLTARIALMQRNAEVFKNDLGAIKLWLTQYYDIQHPNAQKAIAMIDTLQSTELGVELPNLQASLDAVAQYQANKDSQ